MKSPTSKHSKKNKTNTTNKKNKKNKQKKKKQQQQQNVLFCLFVAVVLFQQYPNANMADYLANQGTLRESESNGALRILFWLYTPLSDLVDRYGFSLKLLFGRVPP